jgi:hypothetical protein
MQLSEYVLLEDQTLIFERIKFFVHITLKMKNKERGSRMQKFYLIYKEELRRKELKNNGIFSIL